MAHKTKCPQCGKTVSKESTHCPHCGEALYVKNRKKMMIRVGIVIFCIILLGVAAYFLFHRSKADMIRSGLSEQQSWDLICQYRDTNEPDSLEGALQRYADEYPKGSHAFDVKTLMERLKKEAKLWHKVEEEGSKRESVEKYLFEYKEEGFYFLRAITKLDSITFFEMQELNTVEAYQEYLDHYPDGAYVEQARENLTKLDAVPLTASEEDDMEEVVRKHFDAIASNDTVLARSTVASTMSSYLGKKPCTPRDVNEYIRHMYQTSGRTVSFELSDFVIKKITAFEGGEPIYNITFKLHEEMNKPNQSALTDETSVDYNGTAIVNDEKLITSLLLER